MTLYRMSLWLLAAVASISCSSEPIGPDAAPESTVRSVLVQEQFPEASIFLTVGETSQLVATPRDEDLNAVSGVQVTWQVADESIATVSDSGQLTAVGLGSTRLTATADGVEGSQPVKVSVLTHRNVKAAVQDRFESAFALSVPEPPVYFSRAGDGIINRGRPAHFLSDRWISVVYSGNTRYRIYAWPDGNIAVNEKEVRIVPRGEIRVAIVTTEYPLANLAEIRESVWAALQDSINQVHVKYAQESGFAEPLVRFENTNILLSADEIDDPASTDEILGVLEARGHTESDFDFILSLYMSPDDSQNFIMGDSFESLLRAEVAVALEVSGLNRTTLQLTKPSFRQIASLLYGLGIGWAWGLEVDWTTFCTRAWQTVLEATACPFPFEAHPMLFGWTDTDGDGVPEIIDPTPYGGITS